MLTSVARQELAGDGIAVSLVVPSITATEFAGIAAAAELFSISRYLAIPLAMIVVFVLVLRLPNKMVERIFVIFSLIYLTYVVSGFLAHPDWKQVAHDAVVPQIVHNPAFLVTIVGLIGTTISPYMQFFLQSQVVDKGSR